MKLLVREQDIYRKHQRKHVGCRNFKCPKGYCCISEEPVKIMVTESLAYFVLSPPTVKLLSAGVFYNTRHVAVLNESLTSTPAKILHGVQMSVDTKLGPCCEGQKNAKRTCRYRRDPLPNALHHTSSLMAQDARKQACNHMHGPHTGFQIQHQAC